MTIGKARAIFDNIHSDEFDPEEKLLAIQAVVDMETHNSVSKDSMLEVLRWLIEEEL